MSYHRLIEEAREKAYELHGKTTRKHYDIPYTIHIERVVGYVKAAMHQNRDLVGYEMECCDKVMIISAAYLHDTLEDTNYTYEEMFRDFNHDWGCFIPPLVKDLTNVEKSAGNRAARNKINNARLDKAHKYVKIIKLADRLDNINDLIVSYFKGDITEKYFVMYMEETEELLKYIKVDDCCLYKRLKDLVTKK